MAASRNRWFESASLQRGVCKLSVPRALPRSNQWRSRKRGRRIPIGRGNWRSPTLRQAAKMDERDERLRLSLDRGPPHRASSPAGASGASLARQCQREHGRRQCIQRFGCHSGILLNTSRRDGDRVSIQFDQDPWRLARESGGFAPSKPSSCAPKRRPMTRQTTAGGRWIRTSGSGRPQRGCLRRMIWRRPEGSFRRVAHARQHL